MRIEDFPENNEIAVLRKAILDLEESKDWGAVQLAKIDLYHLLKKREDWVKS